MTKLIAVDMDGTFLNDNKTYDKDKFTKIYQELERKNIKFTVASGNQYYQLVSFFKDFPDVIYVAENGAIVRNQKEILKLSYFSDESSKVIYNFLLKQPELEFLVSGVESAYFPIRYSVRYYDVSTHYYYHLKKINELADIKDHIVKFAISCPDDTSSGHGDIDIIQPGIHKAHGLQELGTLLNIPLSEMTAFGDGGNDLEMIKEVGDGVAMANADPALLQVANHTTTSNNEQGVLTYITDNIL